jgi:adenylate kinase family enzyme
MRLVLTGPPGAGKSTQARSVAEHFNVPAISTGDIFRVNVSEGTPMGVEAKRFVDAGEYVPDEVTNLMVRHRIHEPDAEPGFVLDGYPRTLAQVEELDGMIASTGHRLDAAVAAFFLIAVVVILADSVREWMAVASGRKIANSSELPFILTRLAEGWVLRALGAGRWAPGARR